MYMFNLCQLAKLPSVYGALGVTSNLKCSQLQTFTPVSKSWLSHLKALIINSSKLLFLYHHKGISCGGK